MRRPIWLRIPWQELAVEITVLVALPALTVALGIIDPIKPVYVSLIGIGTVVLVVVGIAHYESWRQPFRRRRPTNKELISAIDGWLLDGNYRRGLAAPNDYFSHLLEVSLAAPAEVKLWIGIQRERDVLCFVSQRGDTINELGTMAPDAA